MIHQLNIYGKDMVEVAIERLQDLTQVFHQTNDEGYWLAFSGGKDSCVIKKLADMANVKYEAHYQVTGLDPPELVRFIKEKYPDVIFDFPRYEDGSRKTMWNLIPKKRTPPTRVSRWCCKELKESAGDGHIVITGVRWAESAKRKATRSIIDINHTRKNERKMIEESSSFEKRNGGYVIVNDNDEARQTIEYCYKRSKVTLNPIVDWEDSDVWEFIREYKVPYCSLYDKGEKRLGCIGCPMQGPNGMKEEFEKYPKYKQLYLMAFKKMLEQNEYKEMGYFTDPESVMKWWIGK